MSTFASVEEAREYFVGDRFAAENGITLDALDGDVCECSVELRDELHRNAAGGVMGGVIFTLADFAFAVASNNLHRLTVALQTSVNFMSAAKGTRLTARSRCVKDGRTTCVYIVDVTDERGTAVAQFVGTGYKL